MNKYNGIGHLLIYKNKIFYIIKNNKFIDEISEKLNTKYDKIIGMCVGNGLWMSTEFNYSKKYIWADAITELCKDKIKSSKDDGIIQKIYME